MQRLNWGEIKDAGQPGSISRQPLQFRKKSLIVKMHMFENLAVSIFSVNSIWSVVLRGGIWLVMSLLILMATDNPNPEESTLNVKSYLGFFVLFIIVSSSLLYLLFGLAPVN